MCQSEGRSKVRRNMGSTFMWAARRLTQASGVCIFFRFFVTPVMAEPPVAEALEVSLGFDSGRVRVTAVRALHLDPPAALPAFVGRFRLHAIGAATTSARFDFPLLAALPDGEPLDAGVHSAVRVRVARPDALRELRITDARSRRTVVVNLRWLAALLPAL